MDSINAQENRDSDIRSQETACGEASREEDVETIDESQDREGNHGDPGADWLDDGVVWDVFFGKTLCDRGFAESNVDDAAADPGDESGCVGEVHKPSEDYTA